MPDPLIPMSLARVARTTRRLFETRPWYGEYTGAGVAVASRNYSLAVQRFTRAIDLCDAKAPGEGAARQVLYVNRGCCYFRLSEFRSAVNDFMHAHRSCFTADQYRVFQRCAQICALRDLNEYWGLQHGVSSMKATLVMELASACADRLLCYISAYKGDPTEQVKRALSFLNACRGAFEKSDALVSYWKLMELLYATDNDLDGQLFALRQRAALVSCAKALSAVNLRIERIIEFRIKKLLHSK